QNHYQMMMIAIQTLTLYGREVMDRPAFTYFLAVASALLFALSSCASYAPEAMQKDGWKQLSQ
ncbi:MAG: hypothetical protein O7E56_11280, partial [SAR324 cluster bacterium]|nr:hypothetical protein [SAR324 cluster bacterium]